MGLLLRGERGKEEREKRSEEGEEKYGYIVQF